MTNEDKEHKKYQEYKKEVEREGPEGLLARLQSGLISLPYKQRAASRAPLGANNRDYRCDDFDRVRGLSSLGSGLL
jgi:hypothetical protein